MASNTESKSDKITTYNIRRYILQSDLWKNWIDDIKKILSDGNNNSTREISHKFLFSPTSPRGSRMGNYINNLDREPNIDDYRNLASMALVDLADYIKLVFDKEFELVRYAVSLTINENNFSEFEKNISSPILKDFYSKILNDKINIQEETLVCISVPFAGTFASALWTGKWLKEKFRKKVFICIGGGFINTELREVQEIPLGKYIDAISYDRGYGSYKNLIDYGVFNYPKNESIYKMTLFESKIIQAKNENIEYEKFENKITESNIPDYSDIDFSKYPRVDDDTNPMQRLWSDGSWIKAYLAHGCY